jgi:hypothetical protein
MATTTKVPRERWLAYFDTFTKRFLRDGSPEAADVELVATDWGDQIPASGTRLLGLTYDPRTDSLEFSLDVGDHRILGPQEVWAVEEPDGFIDSIEIVRGDGGRELVTIKRVGLRRLT